MTRKIWVRGHYRVSKLGNRFYVRGHYRTIKDRFFVATGLTRDELINEAKEMSYEDYFMYYGVALQNHRLSYDNIWNIAVSNIIRETLSDSEYLKQTNAYYASLAEQMVS